MIVPLFDRPHREARRLVSSGFPVYVTVNPVEYHGPHLSLHNDRRLARGILEALHPRIEEALGEHPLVVGADLEVGVEPCAGPGTRHVSFRAVRALVLETCRTLAELGARRVVLATFHGSPAHNLALQAGVDWLERRGVRAIAPFHVVLDAMISFDDPETYAPAVVHVQDPQERAGMLAGLARDFHAGFFETSLSLHLAPETVSPIYRDLPPCAEIRPAPGFARLARWAARVGRRRLAREFEMVAHAIGWTNLRPFPGYTGRPAHATASAGAFFTVKIIERYAEAMRRVFLEDAPGPRPILPWMTALTLAGRLAPRPVPTREVLDFVHSDTKRLEALP